MRLKQLETLIESSKKHALFEGVKIGKKEIEETLNNSADFQMGIEYEVLMPLNGSVGDATTFIEDNSIKNIKEVVPEHDGMTEIITEVMPIPTGINHIKDFFEKAQANNITFPSTAGLHISISHKHHDKKDINFTKFLVLLSGDYLHSLFPERKYVKNISTIIRSTLSQTKQSSIKDMEKRIEDEFEEGDEEEIKYITAKISDYIDMNGRIELRFFGGENYNEQFNEIRWQVLRAVYILAIAYEPDMFRKEYLKTLYSYTQPKRLPKDYDLSNVDPKQALELSNEYADPRLVDIISSNAEYSYKYANEILRSQFKKGEYAISQDGGHSYRYAKNVLNGRFELGEDAISKVPVHSYHYAMNVLEHKFEKGEAAIAKVAIFSYEYAKFVINGRFEKGEDVFATDSYYSFLYAKQVLKGRFEKGEPIMTKELDDDDKEEYLELTGIQL